MKILKESTIQKKIKENDLQISKKGMQQIQNTINELINELIVFSKKSALNDRRKRILAKDIQNGIQKYQEIKGFIFLDQLHLSTKESFEDFFKNKKEELVEWKQN